MNDLTIKEVLEIKGFEQSHENLKYTYTVNGNYHRVTIRSSYDTLHHDLGKLIELIAIEAYHQGVADTRDRVNEILFNQ